MIPTLSERLQARSHDPYWRCHPPAPWGLPLETPVALQVLRQPTDPTTSDPTSTDQLSNDKLSTDQPTAEVQLRDFGGRDFGSRDLGGREWVLLLAIALVWLLEGLEALRQILGRRRRASGSPPPQPQPQGPDSRSRLGRPLFSGSRAGDWLPARAAVQGR
ncbi:MULTISPECIES: hypothetical protein [Aphanothece]|uniref:hypothetical protein n=1 Tax=Aphanothece TaxID=1121 RepID=UPI00398558B4